jgi:hypothetical protein
MASSDPLSLGNRIVLLTVDGTTDAAEARLC